jgi:iron complex transport system ATP-binding protein
MKLRAEGLGLRMAGRWLVRDCSFELTPGAVSVIVGPNGSGKTTLLRALLGLIEPDEGTVFLDEIPLSRHGLRARARVCAWLPQRTELPWGMPAEQLVMLGRAPHLSAFAGPGRADHDAVAAALARVGVTGLAKRDVRTLSGGELQRVLLARLLATEASLLLLDEPTTALDVGHALELLELTRALAAAGHGVIMSLHELELARRYGDQALMLRGDDSGGYVLGSVAGVLTPDLIAEVFGVGALLVDGQLRFHSVGERG